ncbi:MAG: GNAT family N-acetyltransferase, partial [Burkholderiales bacterium]
WAGILRRYGHGGARRRFLVAEGDGRILGFIVGDVRDWEFGSPPCGWIFGIGVRPQAREAGVATAMLEAMTAAFRRLGVATVRTLIARDNRLVLSFFRSQGMMAAPVIPLEKEIG